MTTTLFLTLVYMLAVSVAILYGIKYRPLALILIAGLAFRLFLLLIDYYGIYLLPGSGDDAAAFIERARLWSQLSYSGIFGEFGTGHSYNYSAFGALVFRTFGYHPMTLPAMNLLAGILVVAITGAISYKMWGARAAQLATLIIAFYPFSAFNSAIALREEFSILLFVAGLYFLMSWLWEKSVFGIYICLALFSLATMIHPGWVGAILGVGAYSLYMLIKAVPQFLRGSRVTKRYFGRLVLSASILLFSVGLAVAGGGITLGKGISVGTEESAALAEQIESRFVGVPEGGSAYPTVIATGNPITQPWLIPAKIAYFLYAPFPWDIKSIRHLLGVVSTILMIFLTWRMIRGWKNLQAQEGYLVLLFMLACLVLVYSIGVSNIGTGIRHKTKFMALFIILAASSFDTIKFKLRR